MNELSQIQRMLRILQILSSGRKVTTKELRHRFDDVVTLRTLQRDLLALSEVGIPLISAWHGGWLGAWSNGRVTDFAGMFVFLGVAAYLWRVAQSSRQV